jgi:hypothetical protein
MLEFEENFQEFEERFKNFENLSGILGVLENYKVSFCNKIGLL